MYFWQSPTNSAVPVADERMLEFFDNDSIRRILRVRHRDCVPSVELRRRLCLTSIPSLLVQRRLRWFGHAARRPEGELIKDLLLPTRPRTWRRRAGGQLKTWATTVKADLEPIRRVRRCITPTCQSSGETENCFWDVLAFKVLVVA